MNIPVDSQRLQAYIDGLKACGYPLTGDIALLPDLDYGLMAFQVWCELENGTWLFVQPDGLAVYSDNPLDKEA